MPQLFPFPHHHQPPAGEIRELPITRDGVRKLNPFPFVKRVDAAFQELRMLSPGELTPARGLCGLLPAAAFADGTVRPHEHTLLARLARQRSLVLAEAGALGKPVLLTVPSLRNWWSEVDATHAVAGAALAYDGGETRYTLQAYRDRSGSTGPLDLDPDRLGPLVIADGHHRAATHAGLAAAGHAAFRHVPVVMVGADELRIDTFLRVIEVGTTPVTELLERFRPYFTVRPLATAAPPARRGEWLFSQDGRHFRLHRRAAVPDLTDAGWLNETVLPAVFGITDTRSDPRYQSCIPPPTATGPLIFPAELVPRAKLLGFPVSPAEFFREVAAGRTLPPKSTRFVPRVPSGLLVWMPD